MDPTIVRMAKEIPGRLKEVMNDMFETSGPALRTGVQSLRQTLSKLDTYLADVEREHLGKIPTPATAKTTAKTSPAARAKVVQRRGKRFPMSEFVLAELSKAGRPLKPVELINRLVETTGRDKENASSGVHKVLLRLRQQKLVVRRNGGYSLP